MTLQLRDMAAKQLRIQQAMLVQPTIIVPHAAHLQSRGEQITSANDEHAVRNTVAPALLLFLRPRDLEELPIEKYSCLAPETKTNLALDFFDNVGHFAGRVAFVERVLDGINHRAGPPRSIIVSIH